LEKNNEHQEHVHQARVRNVTTRKWLADYKLSRGCVDCGFGSHPAALQLDHEGEKSAEISSLRSSIVKMSKEIEAGKCIVRCANCHSIKTWAEKNNVEYRPRMFVDSDGSSYALALFASSVATRLIRRDGAPYLWRTYLGGGDGARCFLHRFVSDDTKNELHSHPFEWSFSIILVGSYREHRASGRFVGESSVVLSDRFTRVFCPGSRNYISWDTFHRVELVTKEVWTLFFHGPRTKDWGFVRDTVRDRPLPVRVVSGRTSDKLPLQTMPVPSEGSVEFEREMARGGRGLVDFLQSVGVKEVVR
jgi:hypothetical protein